MIGKLGGHALQAKARMRRATTARCPTCPGRAVRVIVTTSSVLSSTKGGRRVSQLRDFEWWGVVGPQPLPLMGGVIFDAHDRSRRLAKPSTVGPLTLQAPEDPLVEWRRGDPRSLDAIEKFESWPIIVQGVTGAVARHKADREASQLLHRAAVRPRNFCIAPRYCSPWLGMNHGRNAPRPKIQPLYHHPSRSPGPRPPSGKAVSPRPPGSTLNCRLGLEMGGPNSTKTQG
jgi:hypothetical protein